MTFEKHLRSVFREASKRHDILRKSWQVFCDRLHFGRCFQGFVQIVLEYCLAVRCSAADTNLKLQDRVVNGWLFLNWVSVWVWLCNRRSVVVLYMLYKIRCNQMHPLYGAIPEPYVLVRVTHSAAIPHQYTYMSPRCRTSQYPRTVIPLSVSLWINLGDPVFDGVELAGFNCRANAFLLA